MKLLKLLFIAALTGLVVYSCSKGYLNKRPLGPLDETALSNKKGVEGLLIGAYSLLDGNGDSKNGYGSAGSNWVYGSICGSEAYKGSQDGDQGPEITTLEQFKPTADNPFLAAKWGVVYDGVQRANDVLRILPKAKDVSVNDQKIISAEARFLRAYYHFEAKRIWNNVPFIEETITYENGNYHVTNEKDIWPDIESDLIYASNNLTEISFGGAVGRANKYTAMAVLAKVYMFEKKFAEAKPLLEAIINSNKYHLISYADNFNGDTKNNPESIFSAQTSVNDGATGTNGNASDALNFPMGGPGGCCGFFQPSQYFVNHFKTNAATGLPDLINFNTTDIKNDVGLHSTDPFAPYTGTLDPRLDWTIGRRGIPYLDWGNHPGWDWIRDQNYGGPYSPKKNVYYKSQEGRLTEIFWSNLTANNINLIRYADVLLWAAEAEIEIGDLNKARVYVNQVRSRAADPAGWVYTYTDPSDPLLGFTNTPAANYKVGEYIVPWTDKNFARTAVRYERILELGMEGQRFFDLVRWGIADTEINAYIQKEKLGRTYLNNTIFTKNKNEYFPIPQLQIDLSAGADGVRKMKQNPGY